MQAIPTILVTTLVADRRARFERVAERRRRFRGSRRVPAPGAGRPVTPLPAGRTPAGSAGQVDPTPTPARAA